MDVSRTPFFGQLAQTNPYHTRLSNVDNFFMAFQARPLRLVHYGTHWTAHRASRLFPVFCVLLFGKGPLILLDWWGLFCQLLIPKGCLALHPQVVFELLFWIDQKDSSKPCLCGVSAGAFQLGLSTFLLWCIAKLNALFLLSSC